MQPRQLSSSPDPNPLLQQSALLPRAPLIAAPAISPLARRARPSPNVSVFPKQPQHWLAGAAAATAAPAGVCAGTRRGPKLAARQVWPPLGRSRAPHATQAAPLPHHKQVAPSKTQWSAPQPQGERRAGSGAGSRSNRSTQGGAQVQLASRRAGDGGSPPCILTQGRPQPQGRRQTKRGYAAASAAAALLQEGPARRRVCRSGGRGRRRSAPAQLVAPPAVPPPVAPSADRFRPWFE